MNIIFTCIVSTRRTWSRTRWRSSSTSRICRKRCTTTTRSTGGRSIRSVVIIVNLVINQSTLIVLEFFSQSITHSPSVKFMRKVIAGLWPIITFVYNYYIFDQSEPLFQILAFFNNLLFYIISFPANHNSYMERFSDLDPDPVGRPSPSLN